MILYTMQSKEVADIIKQKGIYVPSKYLMKSASLNTDSKYIENNIMPIYTLECNSLVEFFLSINFLTISGESMFDYSNSVLKLEINNNRILECREIKGAFEGIITRGEVTKEILVNNCIKREEVLECWNWFNFAGQFNWRLLEELKDCKEAMIAIDNWNDVIQQRIIAVQQGGHHEVKGYEYSFEQSDDNIVLHKLNEFTYIMPQAEVSLNTVVEEIVKHYNVTQIEVYTALMKMRNGSINDKVSNYLDMLEREGKRK